MKKGPKSKEIAQEFILVIPNIRSAHNVGSLFRTADGAGVSKIYLCGYTPIPIDKFGRLGKPQKEIAKTALGAEKSIPYEYLPTLKQTVAKLKKDGVTVIGLEQDEKALKMGSRRDEDLLKNILKQSHKIALVVGEEVDGMTKADLKLMDHVIELPMKGQKESLNVSVAGGIAMYFLSLLK